MKDLTPIRFVKAQSPYKKGDVAGFEDRLAEKYIKAGVAKAYDAPAVDKQVKSPAKKK